MRQINNPPNPYQKYSAEFLGEPSPTKLEIYEEYTTKKVITKAYSSDFGHRYTVNCYRGCIHACTYCFARQYHEYLGYGAGTDFETKIVVKPNAPILLWEELKRTRERINHLDFSFATDPYLPLEANYELTGKCLEISFDYKGLGNFETIKSERVFLDSVSDRRKIETVRAFHADTRRAFSGDENFDRRGHRSRYRHRADYFGL